MNKPRTSYLVNFLAMALALFSLNANAAVINFSGPLDFVDADNGTGVYSGVAIGTEFSGNIDDVTASGSISDGVTLTSFGCCIAAGGLSVLNDTVLTAEDAAFLNSIIGSPKYSAGDLVDGVDIEGDDTTLAGGRIEVGLSYILDPNAFANTDTSNYPFNPGDVELALFFILEEDADGLDIYSAGGQINPVPVPAAVYLFASGLLGLIGVSRRRKAV
ncbi:MAG: hypothetical protein ABF297_15445 [Thiogranum sp.]